MRGIRFAAISVIVLFGLITAIGLLFSSRVTVVRQVEIQASYDTVFNYVNDINQWKKWMLDSSVAVALYTPSARGKGASAQVGNSRATILSDDSSLVRIQWQPHNGKIQESGISVFPSHSVPGGVTVQWYFTQQLSWYPWERIAATLNEKILGPSMENDLARLKAVAENKE